MSAERVRGGRRAPGTLDHAAGHRRPGGRRGLRGPLVVGLLALSAALTSTPLLAPAGLAAAATTTATETRITLLAAPSASGIARPGEPLSVRVTVTNTGQEATPELALALAIEGARPSAPDRVEQWLAGSTIESDARTASTATISPIEPGASAVLDLIVPASRPAASGAFGARLAVVRATAGDELIAADRTAVVWVPTGSTPPSARTVFIAPISTPGIADGLLDAETLAALTAEAGDLHRQLDAVAGRPVLVAIDPRVVASIRLLGADAPASALAFLERLAAMPNETTLLPWADADALGVLAVGGRVPEPEGAGAVAPTDGEGASDDPEPSPSALDLATAAEWPTTFDELLWAGDGLSADLLSGIADAGARTVIAPSTALEGREVSQTAAGLRLIRADAALGAVARDASTAMSQQRFDRAVAQVSALLAAQAAADPQSVAVIPLSRDVLPSSDRLIDTIGRTVSLPWSTAGTLAEAVAEPSADAAITGAAASGARADAIEAALAAESADRAFAAVAVEPTAITDVRRLELLAALSQGWGDRSVDALTAFVEASARLRSGIRVAESSAITLLADRASLPVTVQNDLDVPVRVFVRVEPDTTQLRVLDPRVEVLVEPRSQTRAVVPVESLTNGRVDITVTVQDGSGTRISEPTRVSLNLLAGWETAGTITVGIAVVVLLVVGISRDIRKRRQQSAGETGRAETSTLETSTAESNGTER
ncbi:DUF6049 family protein [Microcella frigidaquae]|uniref:Uncharacterized protein n=1 Tax=Microcella frigidaquae TaxID=424758 RepID=A0A840XHN2_9MICO|nr:DUF6049 family protein [Microcella frigidaquae]MBB5618012.1 hypothetical protein [Microcella frigidaquae]NHN44276.1 hypothetical protein [Microcella frigidaquae]